MTELCDKSYIFSGGIEKQGGHDIYRVVPYILYINAKECNEKNIAYFNDKYMHGLGGRGDNYDTGAWFYMATESLNRNIIRWGDYCVHFGNGSWNKGTSSMNKFLQDNKALWHNEEEKHVMEKTNYTQYKHNLEKRGYNIDNPQTIQDKIQWLKIYDSTPLKTKCADKIKVHEYCKEKLGEDICIPILKTYKSTAEINWDELPEQFVMKCNHGSGMNIIVKNKSQLDKTASISKLNRWLATDFAFQNGYELQYHNIERRIFVEEYKEDDNQKISLFDYKFWCFNGTPRFYTINDGHGHGDIIYYKMSGEIMNPYMVSTEHEYKKPLNFEKMVEYSKKLSEEFKFVRVDFYEINGKVYLGELTFTPGSGFFKYKDKKYDKLFGDMLNLKNKKVIYTCITGEYEYLEDPYEISQGYDYVCFTNYDKIESTVWQIRPIPEELKNLSEVKKQRCIKINAHKYLPEYDFSIWVDGCVKLKKDVNAFVDKNCINAHIFIPKHPNRNCIYDEANICIKIRKDVKEHIDPQMEKYRSEGFPKNYGLVQSNIMMRYHNEPDCIKVMEAWSDELINGSHRDQLSFNYVLWKNPDVSFVYLDKNTCNSEYFYWDKTHKKAKPNNTVKTTAQTSMASDNKEKREYPVMGITITQKKTSNVRTSNTPSIRRTILSKRLKKFLTS